MEFAPTTSHELEFKFVAPFAQSGNEVKCLAENLNKDSNNSKFIFNDNIKNFQVIKGDKRNGAILTFENRNDLAILPLERLSLSSQIISFKIKLPDPNLECPCYIRFLIRVKKKTLSTIKKGITNTSFIYDIKLNEKRNLPNEVHNLIKDEYRLCKVENCFCFHVIPNNLNISFVDQNKLKNIRELEVKAFKNYLPEELEKMKEDRYIIVFNKASKEESYSFFTIFTKEIIGTNQILLAIGTNILCSLLFAIAGLRLNFKSGVSIWKQIPIEYWLAFIVLILLALFLFRPNKKMK
ncbi:MAG TPA: hypothetical protein DDW85_10445 [Porphyromonadaceae bacterium]|nr:hypothetical protein [Porphyromonadaceae bacterium]